jgi:hypothetical protein
MVVPLGLELNDGWFDILWRLCTDLEPLVLRLEAETGRPFGIFKVMEKFGELHFYPNQVTEAISKRIAAAEQEAAQTCEVCGQPGTRREGGERIRITCEEHAK